jgi:hypothetical protein
MYTHILFYLLDKQCSTLVFANDRTFDDVSLAVSRIFLKNAQIPGQIQNSRTKFFFPGFPGRVVGLGFLAAINYTDLVPCLTSLSPLLHHLKG